MLRNTLIRSRTALLLPPFRAGIRVHTLGTFLFLHFLLLLLPLLRNKQELMTVLHQGKALFSLSYGALSDVNFVQENFFLIVVTSALEKDKGVFVAEDRSTEFEIFMFEFLHQL